MSKHIERSKVNDEIVRVLEHTDCKDEHIDRVLMAIEKIPTIEVMEYSQVDGITPTLITTEVSEGEWIFEEYPDGHYHSECSICKHWFVEDAFLKPYKYCPNCGARMSK